MQRDRVGDDTNRIGPADHLNADWQAIRARPGSWMAIHDMKWKHLPRCQVSELDPNHKTFRE